MSHPAAAERALQSARPIAREGARLQFVAFDASYLERLQQLDVRTEQHFVAYFSELIRLKLRSRLGSKEALEDVRQETFVRVLALLRAPDGIRQPERLGALVNSVCNHVLFEHYRAHLVTHANIDEQPEYVFEHQGASAITEIEAADAERVVRHVLSQLPERDRRLLRAVLLEERDKDAVCAEFGVTREYLRVLIHRAKLTFKASLIRSVA